MVKSFFTEQVIEDTIKNALKKSDLQKQIEFSNNFLKEQNFELRAAYNFKSQFLHNMNQETRHLLKEIYKLSKCIISVKDTDERAKLLEVFKKSNLCLSEFIKAISDYSKMECGHLKEHKEDFNLLNLLNSAVDVMTPLAKQKSIALNYTLDEEIPLLVNGDSKKLLRILLNLLSNALKFSSKDSIKICVEKNEAGPIEKIRFSITDASSELSKVIKHKNFHDSQEAEASINNRFAGADIRLFLSKSIVEFMGGRIWVECDKEEVLKFIFEIPL